jgi:hypothetical protein
LKDVEHSSETVADTQPLMLAMEPDNPLYVTRNKKLLPIMKGIWTGRTPKGHLHFKSIFISAERIDNSPQTQGSVPYHLRAIKGLTWLMWHADYPEIKKCWLDLAGSWLYATLSAEQGKLPGIVPASVAYSNERLGGLTGSWLDPKYPWRYYNFSNDNQRRVFNLLTSAYIKTGDLEFFKPIELALKLSEDYTPTGGNPKEGSEDWQRMKMREWSDRGFFIPFLLSYRLNSGKTKYDEYLKNWDYKKAGANRWETDPAILHYQIHRDLADIETFYESALKKLRVNLPMYTTEMPQTDRMTLEGAREIYLLMTGATEQWNDAAMPSHVVTWFHPNAEFAALVNPITKHETEIDFYSFDQSDEVFGLNLWNFPLGKVDISWEMKVKDDWSEKQNVSVDYTKRGQKFELRLPYGKHIKIRLTGHKE